MACVTVDHFCLLKHPFLLTFPGVLLFSQLLFLSVFGRFSFFAHLLNAFSVLNFYFLSLYKLSWVILPTSPRLQCSFTAYYYLFFFQVQPQFCLMDISTWMSLRHMSEVSPFSHALNPVLLFPHLCDGTIYPAA